MQAVEVPAGGIDRGDAKAPERSVARHVVGSALAIGLPIAVDIAFVAFLAFIGELRWQVVSSTPLPTGLDPGNWLAFGHTFLGSTSRSASIVYPPLVPLLTVAFGAIWGTLRGIQILASVSALAPAAGAYVLLRRRLGLRGALLAALLTTAATTSEPAAWGGYPQLFGLGFLALVIWATDSFVRTQQLRWALVAGVMLLLTLAASDIIGVAAAAAAVTFLFLRVSLSDESHRLRPRLLGYGILVAAIPTLPIIPTYVALAGVVLRETSKSSSQRITFQTLVPHLNHVFRDNPGLWWLVTALTIAAPLLLLRKKNRALAGAATAILVPTSAALLLTGEPRLFFLLPVASIIALGGWWLTVSSSKRLALVTLDRFLLVIVLVVVVVQSAVGMDLYPRQVKAYTALTPGIVSGLDQVNQVAPRGAVLAVSPGADSSGWPLGWWVEGLLDRPTYYASDTQWLNFADERRRASLANQMFNPNEGVDGAVTLARTNRINYIVVVTHWSGYRAWAANARSLTGATVIIDTDSLLVIRVDG